MKRFLLTVFLLLLMVTAVISIYWFFMRTTPEHDHARPVAVSLWAEGRFEIPLLAQNPNTVRLNAHISEPAALNMGVPLNFELSGDDRYFVMTVYHSTPGLAHILSISLSNGDRFYMSHPVDGGATHIIYSAESWPAGVHYVVISNANIYATPPDNANGEVRVHVAAANNLDAVTVGLTPPPLNTIMTMEAVEGTLSPYGATFDIRNFTAYDVEQNHTCFIERQVNGSWQRVMVDEYENYWFGLLEISVAAGRVQLFRTNWGNRLGALDPGVYRLIVPYQYWRWVNDGGLVLRKAMPLSAEFVIYEYDSYIFEEEDE